MSVQVLRLLALRFSRPTLKLFYLLLHSPIKRKHSNLNNIFNKYQEISERIDP